MDRLWLTAFVLLVLYLKYGRGASIQEEDPHQGKPLEMTVVAPNLDSSADRTSISAKERFFALVKFHPEACEISTTMIGTCTTSTDCTNRGGSNIGPCAKGFGVCCLLTLSCSAQNTFINVRDKAVILENTAGSTSCTYELPRLEGSCQLMVEFLEFNLQAPVISTGVCNAESLRISGSATVGTGLTICGMNNGQRIYLSYGRGERVTLEFNTPSNGRYRIRVRHIQCNSPLLAPTQCLQYYTTGTGIVRSFSYGNGIVANEYSVCVQDLGNSRSIEWQECVEGVDTGAISGLRSQFHLSNNFVSQTPQTAPIASRFGATGRTCEGTSYVEVFGERKHCGARFTVETLAGGQIPISSVAKPYQLFVRTVGNTYMPPPGLPPPAYAVGGYSVHFPYPLAGSSPDPFPCDMIGTPVAMWPAFTAACVLPTVTDFWQCTCALLLPTVDVPLPQRTGFCLKYTLM